MTRPQIDPIAWIARRLTFSHVREIDPAGGRLAWSPFTTLTVATATGVNPRRDLVAAGSCLAGFTNNINDIQHSTRNGGECSVTP